MVGEKMELLLPFSLPPFPRLAQKEAGEVVEGLLKWVMKRKGGN